MAHNRIIRYTTYTLSISQRGVMWYLSGYGVYLTKAQPGVHPPLGPFLSFWPFCLNVMEITEEHARKSWHTRPGKKSRHDSVCTGLCLSKGLQPLIATLGSGLTSTRTPGCAFVGYTPWTLSYQSALTDSSVKPIIMQLDLQPVEKLPFSTRSHELLPRKCWK